MHIRLFLLLMVASILGMAQGPHSQLIDITKQDASIMSGELGLSDEQSKQLTSIYVKHAMATEDVIVSSNPEINLLKEIKSLEKARDKEIKSIMTAEEYQLYAHKKKQVEDRASSEFDSLQVFLNDPDFNNAVIEYFDQDVSPYLVYYYHTYFTPALKQKHFFKINQQRLKITELQFQIDSVKEVTQSDDLPDKITDALDDSFKELKRLRKKYKEELDYINVALSQVEREWDLAYVNMVKAHYKDDAFQRIENYNKYLNAYGIDYLVGGFSMLLFDIYYPRSYVENRDVLIKMISQ